MTIGPISHLGAANLSDTVAGGGEKGQAPSEELGRWTWSLSFSLCPEQAEAKEHTGVCSFRGMGKKSRDIAGTQSAYKPEN